MKKFIKLNDNRRSIIRIDNIQSITVNIMGSMSNPIYQLSILFGLHGVSELDYTYGNMIDLSKDKNKIEEILIGGGSDNDNI